MTVAKKAEGFVWSPTHLVRGIVLLYWLAHTSANFRAGELAFSLELVAQGCYGFSQTSHGDVHFRLRLAFCLFLADQLRSLRTQRHRLCSACGSQKDHRL